MASWRVCLVAWGLVLIAGCSKGTRISSPATPPPPTARAAEAAPPKPVEQLAPAAIQAVIREIYPSIKACYESALGRDPKTTGKVVTRFVIGRDGLVSSAALSAGTTLSDAEACECVVSVFRPLVFPKPSNGIVTVVYPVVLSPE